MHQAGESVQSGSLKCSSETSSSDILTGTLAPPLSHPVTLQLLVHPRNINARRERLQPLTDVDKVLALLATIYPSRVRKRKRCAVIPIARFNGDDGRRSLASCSLGVLYGVLIAANVDRRASLESVITAGDADCTRCDTIGSHLDKYLYLTHI